MSSIGLLYVPANITPTTLNMLKTKPNWLDEKWHR